MARVPFDHRERHPLHRRRDADSLFEDPGACLLDIDKQLRTAVRDADEAHQQDILSITPGSMLRRLVEDHGGGDWEDVLIKACNRAGDFSLDPFNVILEGERTTPLSRAFVRMMQKQEKGRRKINEYFNLTNESDSDTKSAVSETGTENRNVKEEEARRGEAP